jgi:hypothetical protein
MTGVGGRLEVVAVGLPPGALAFGEPAKLEVMGYRRCRWSGAEPYARPDRPPPARPSGRVTLGVGRRPAHSPDRRHRVGEAVVPLRVDRVGIMGMRERAVTIGGTLEARPVEGGFRVEAHLPYSRP